ncbi:hypothetical protein Pla22_00340 [Rubripirellula amarantea]|uniref:AAA+ ATPase domain-containing protein n=1 Tax=Rubripirellula amarantea TaxID=2527999 RepID=A0A5C5WPQ6_9BACT|nr:molybdopterin-guanine dinucleotide biosynthesis protein MobB [Rubripirellula amarantea]TWT52410.1 hypothetical protein Pla22_00340 [Rubripirellula amarantea]
MIESNPFRTAAIRPGSIPFRFVGKAFDRSINDLASDVRDLTVCQIVGQHGTGKSTLVKSLLPSLRDAFADVAYLQPLDVSPLRLGSSSWTHRWIHAYRSLSDAVSTARRLAGGGLLIVDGAEQLSRLGRIKLYRATRQRNQSLLMTTHQPFRSVPVLYRTEVSLSDLATLTLERVSDSSEDVQRLVGERLRQQQQQPQGNPALNVRDFWFDLYDEVQPVCRSARGTVDQSVTTSAGRHREVIRGY